MFDTYGTASFRRFIGDWAISIYDPRQRTIILARDYIGVKQLFYSLKGETLLWCSHLAWLAQSGGVFEICPDYIAGYLRLTKKSVPFLPEHSSSSEIPA
ncbi:MAG: hypothetical protein DMG79_22485 [Acidobacteria bacterium]|nr:MAG: hypothetical protein DMG79_22485 [Acidobacteriota bacterium]